MSWLTLFFSPEGRINRAHFWLGWLILFGGGLLIGWFPVFGQIAVLLSLYCHVCVYAKRLHDMGRTGWLQIIPFLAFAILPLVGLIMSGATVFSNLHRFDNGADWWVIAQAFGWLALGFLAAGTIWTIFLIWIGASGGQPGENRFGPPAPTSLA
ncbi:uncharacterized membrane protein YhaH (DUF805 family) [Caulobacter ginsengisoli]|uniref:Uncharacterized membrane protein YhaH (DUF805 family) n=1 Tax=Caulobacter ginsengisoli TaxID=400775 RepID=A0ABU0INB6_9CAUL|nr:DUF805 domain-containing protein [Caulobacter ginsengisoli]MDQ0463510.1 uncharacterized membrane protein YhaH (DUF805 family) [Caulobacter ginsengisoli]